MASFSLSVLSPDLIVRMEWAQKWASKNWPMAVPLQVDIRAGYRNIDHARNAAISDATGAGRDFLIFWDDDVLPRDDNMLGRMVVTIMQEENSHMTVLSGIYPRKMPGLSEPILVKKPGSGVWWKPIRDRGLHQVHATGTGFTIFNLRQMATMEVPEYEFQGRKWKQYFHMTTGYPMNDPGTAMYTDDFYFAELCVKNKKEWWVDGACICDQITAQGQRFRIEDAMPRIAK